MTVSMHVRLAGNGRMGLPRVGRDALGIHGGAKVVLTVEGDGLRVVPIRHGAARAQDLCRAHARRRSSVDDFLAERRADATREG